MKSSAIRARIQRFLTQNWLLPHQPGRPVSKVMRICELEEFPAAGSRPVAERSFELPPLRESSGRICGRLTQQESIPARDFFGVQLQNAHVFGPSVMVVTDHGTVICEISKEWGVYLDAPEASWIQRRFWLPKARRLAGKTFLLASTGSETFNHWMMESLPRLGLGSLAHGSMREISHWLVSRKSSRFVRETLGRFGIPWNRVHDFRESQHWACDSLVSFSLGGDWGMPSAFAVEFLRKSFLTTGETRSRRFYLLRGQTQDRRVEDESTLVSALTQLGFTPLDCGSLGVIQTAAILSQAECIIAPHGAALTNMVFAPAGCQILEIFNPSFTNPCYRMLAARCGHFYAAFYGRTTHLGPNRPADASGTIFVDLGKLVTFWHEVEQLASYRSR